MIFSDLESEILIPNQNYDLFDLESEIMFPNQNS